MRYYILQRAKFSPILNIVSTETNKPATLLGKGGVNIISIIRERLILKYGGNIKLMSAFESMIYH